MCGPGLDRDGSRLGESSRQVTAYEVRTRDVDAALMGCQLVADSSREFASFVRRQNTVQVACHEQRPIRLPLEYLAQSPRISEIARKLSRLREIRLCRVCFVENDAAARYERANQQRMVVGFARGRQCRVDFFHIRGSNEPYHESSSALSESALTRAVATSVLVRRVVGKRGVEPGQPFANAALPEPH